jgi:hypothetical protein
MIKALARRRQALARRISALVRRIRAIQIAELAAEFALLNALHLF